MVLCITRTAALPIGSLRMSLAATVLNHFATAATPPHWMQRVATTKRTGTAICCANLIRSALALPAAAEVAVQFNQRKQFVQSRLRQAQLGVEVVGLVGQDFEIAGAATPIAHF